MCQRNSRNRIKRRLTETRKGNERAYDSSPLECGSDSLACETELSFTRQSCIHKSIEIKTPIANDKK